MIKTKEDLREYILADESKYGKRKPALLGWFFGDESYVTLKFLKRLRYTEYYFNTLNKKNPFVSSQFRANF